MNVLGIDPGREKIGLAVVRPDGHILWRAIIAPDELRAELPLLVAHWLIYRIALGDSTAFRDVKSEIEAVLPNLPGDPPQLQIIDESNSTLAARDLYWIHKPPTGWKQYWPLSLQTPPEPIDDFAAAIIALRSLKPTPGTPPVMKRPGRPA